MKLLHALLFTLPLLAVIPASAQDVPDLSELVSQAALPKYPPPAKKDFIIKNFKFESGAVLPELRIHYLTLGNKNGPKVLILHGSGGQGADWLWDSFANEMFGPDQPLDARKYFIILPDNIGHGKSSRASDGLGAAFPKYTVGDSIAAQYKLVTEGLGITHLRLVLGHSMGGRETWTWGVQYPDFMDALVPMATSPGNWTRAAEVQLTTAPMLENIKAYVLAINSADDAGNPPERAGLEAAVARTPHGSFYVIPKGRDSIGHPTTFIARLWSSKLKTFLDTVPKQ